MQRFIFCRVLDIRVSEIVNPDAFNACGFRTPVHLMVQICLGDGEDAVVGFQPIQRLDVVLHLIHEKLRDFDRSVALGRLGRRDDDIALDVLVPSSIMRKFIYKSGRTQSAQGRETCP